VTQAQDTYGAAKAGILRDDVVMKIDGKPLKDFDRLTAVISQYEPGDVVEVTILRGEKTMTKQVTLSDQPPE
jgi:S1-C subfamily serine protease